METENRDQEMLRVEHLYQYFGTGGNRTKAVEDVSFRVKKGEIVGLVGESGCGKTTTARSIIKLYPISGGKIWFDGKLISVGTEREKEAVKAAKAAVKRASGDTERQATRKHLEEANIQYHKTAALAKELDKKYPSVPGIQMIFQDPVSSLNPRMTIQEIVAEGLRIRGMKEEREIEKRVSDVLDRVGLLPEHASRYPHEFSGGQRQRIGIARALIMEPKMILADEPISALDVSVQAQILNLLAQLREEMGLTVLFIAHDLSVVRYFSDRIGVMYLGRLVEMAEADELFERPLHGYTRALLSAIPVPDPHYEKQRRRLVYREPELSGEERAKQEFREVFPGHFLLCTEEEAEEIRRKFL